MDFNDYLFGLALILLCIIYFYISNYINKKYQKKLQGLYQNSKNELNFICEESKILFENQLYTDFYPLSWNCEIKKGKILKITAYSMTSNGLWKQVVAETK